MRMNEGVGKMTLSTLSQTVIKLALSAAVGCCWQNTNQAGFAEGSFDTASSIQPTISITMEKDTAPRGGVDIASGADLTFKVSSPSP